MRRVYRRRFSSLDSAPRDARDHLRSRLALLREAPSFERGSGVTAAAREWAADELMLRMLQRCVPDEDPRGVPSGQRELAAHVARNPANPVTWDRLVAQHWVRVVWGRWHVPYHMRRGPDADQPDDAKAVIMALNHLQGVAHQDRRFVVADAERLVAEHKSAHPGTPAPDELVVAGLLSRDGDSFSVAPNSPVLSVHGAWLAARLWDRKEAGPSGLERLSWWRDRVFDLGVGWFDFGEHLGVDAREEFERLAWERVLAEDDLVGWERERERYAAQVAAEAGLGILERGLKVIDRVPAADGVARVRWIDNAGPANHNQEERGDVGALVSTIMRWRGTFRGRSPWQESISELVEAAKERPYLLYKIDLAVGRDPALAADLLLVPEAAAVGLAVLADGLRSTGRGWNWEVKEGASREAEGAVWQDVAECAAWALHQLVPEEAAAQVAAVLERYAALARPAMNTDPGRGAQLRSRYEVLREVVARWPAHGSGEELAFDGLGGAVVGELAAMMGGADTPIEEPAFDVLAWLAAFGADDRSPWRGSAARAVVDAYRWGLSSPSNRYHDAEPDAATWTRIARWLVENDGAAWSELLIPADFRARAWEVGQLGEAERYGAQRSFVHQLRTHVLLLLTLSSRWSEVRRGEAVPVELEEALAAMLRNWLRADEDVGRPSLVDAEVDIEHFFERQRESLLALLGAALPRLSQRVRTETLGHVLAALTEVRQIATFMDALEDGPDKEVIRARLASLPVFAGTDDIGNITEVQRSVDALLDAGEIQRAEVWLERWAGRARDRRINGWARWEVGVRQRVLLARKQFEDAARAPLPEWAKGDHEAVEANEFFRGVALLHTGPPRPDEAVRIYEKLVRAAPQHPSYAVNLFAARTQQLTRGRDDAEPTPEEDDSLRDLLAYGESLLSAFAPVQRAAVEQTYQVNRLYLFRRLRDWPSLLAAYQSLTPSLQKDPTLASYAARALESSGQPSLAAALRADAGATDGAASEPRGTVQVDPVEAARQAILRVPEFAMHDQARAWWGTEIGEAVTAEVLDACMALADIAPALALPEKGEAHEEDRVTKLLAELLRQRVLKLGWQVSSQEHGGYTAKDPSGGRGGIGEIDLEIRAGSAHVAVGEAVIADGFDAGVLRAHFQKLFGYALAGTPVAFLLIWNYGVDPASVWGRYLQEVACKAAPLHHEFRSWEAAGAGPISHVWHAVSEHAHPDAGKCRVAHVLVDLRHATRREVAIAARAAGPKR